MRRYWDRTPERLIEHGPRLGADGVVLVAHEQRLHQQQLTMQPPQPARRFAWQQHFSTAEHAEILSHPGDTLTSLEYCVPAKTPLR